MAEAPARQRAEGRVALEMARIGAGSRVLRLAEAGSARLRMPRVAAGATPEAVIINTAGGVAAGDRFGVSIEVGPDAALVATGAAAEKIYRSDGATATIETRLTLGRRARLDWLPQETILFDRARLARRLEADLAPDASALLYEAVVFGRKARGERVEEGAYRDRWRVRRGGRLVYADTTRLEGPIAALLDRPAIAGGMRAFASLLFCAPDAEARIEEARAHLEGAGSECGASAWNGLLLVRWLAPDGDMLRRDAARFMLAFRRQPLPRVWHL